MDTRHEALDRLFAHCASVFDGRTEIGFRAATRHFLPPHERRYVIAMWALLRTVDDIVDEADVPEADKPRALAAYRDTFHRAVAAGASSDPVLGPMVITMRDTGMHVELFDRFFRSMELDLTKRRYESFAELADYAQGSAVIFGLLLMYIWGVPRVVAEHGDAIRDYCTATQLVNVVCDVGEDLEKGRVYLPQDELRRFGVTVEPGLVTAGPRWVAFMEFQVTRMRALLARGAVVERALPERAVRWLRAVTDTFVAVLDNLERIGYDVMARPAAVIPLGEKLRWYRSTFARR